MANNTQKLKRVVVKEELVALTGDWLAALVLNQFLYWSERVRDVDAFIREEKARADTEIEIELQHGWIYKKAEQLSEELMNSASRGTIQRRIQILVDAGWLDRRNNPKYRWDRTLQYRPDILKIQTDLHELGYALEGYPLQLMDTPLPTVSNRQPTDSNRDDHSEQAVPETTTETTTDTPPVTADFLETAVDFDQELFGDAAGRPKGWRACSEDEYAVCERVAQHWRNGILPGQTKFIEESLAGAAELLTMFNGEGRETLKIIDEFHRDYRQRNRDFTVKGPSSLVNEIPAFLSKRKPPGPPPRDVYDDPQAAAFRQLREKQEKGNDSTSSGNGTTLGNTEPQGTGNSTGGPRRTVPPTRYARP